MEVDGPMSATGYAMKHRPGCRRVPYHTARTRQNEGSLSRTARTLNVSSTVTAYSASDRRRSNNKSSIFSPIISA